MPKSKELRFKKKILGQQAIQKPICSCHKILLIKMIKMNMPKHITSSCKFKLLEVKGYKYRSVCLKMEWNSAGIHPLLLLSFFYGVCACELSRGRKLALAGTQNNFEICN